MAWMDEIQEIVSRYTSGGSGGAAPARVSSAHQDYCDIAATAPPQVMADALAHTFRSDQTPAFPEMVASLFQESNSEQRVGLLNRLAKVVGIGAVGGGAAQAQSGASGESVTPDTAGKLSPDRVQQIASQAQQSDPSIVDRVSGFYAQHPDVVKALGGAAISIAIQHIARRR